MRPAALRGAFISGVVGTGVIAVVRASVRNASNRISNVRTPPVLSRNSDLRRLQDEPIYSNGHRNTGGLLRVFDQVWTDASSVETATLVSECIKPKKKKKKKGDESDTRAGGGKGGKGGGKSGGGKSGSRSSSSWSSATDMRPISSNDGDWTFVQSSTTRKGSKGKVSKGGSGDGSIRICEGYDEEGNLINPVSPSNPVAPPSATPQDGPMASPAQGGEGINAPPNSPGAAPASPGVPVIAVPSVPTVTSSPNTFPEPPSPPPVAFVGQEAVCDAYEAGRAPTTAPSQTHVVKITLNVDRNITDPDPIFTQMELDLRENVAPLLLKCVNSRRMLRRSFLERKLQGNATEYVNVVFGNVTEDSDANCTPSASNAICIPSSIGSTLYYFGEEPDSFGEQLRQAILLWDFDIDGLLGFGNVQVATEIDSNGGEGGDEGGGEGGGEGGDEGGVDEVGGDDPSETTPTPGPRGRGLPPVGTAAGIEDIQSSDSGVNPGAFVAAAVAALTLILVALFVARRLRDQSSDSVSKHRELNDDDDDLGNETDDNTAMTPVPPPQHPLSYIVGDDESWKTGNTGQGHEMYTIPQHGPDEECSSPTCEICEIRRQSGTRFVVANAGLETPPRDELQPREYVADDTVSL